MVAASAFGYSLADLPLAYDLALPQAALPITPPPAFALGFHSTARDAKLWPVAHWIALGKHLSSRGLALLLPWGNEAERIRAQTIAQQVPGAMALPKMSLAQLTCLIKQAKLAVGLDTGLMHIAVALDIPTLAIFCDTHIWQAGAMPATSGRAITIGGKPAQPGVAEATAAIDLLLEPR
jgi:heptosyltransferase-1